jgi:molybdenum cofactor cytidylyltransferase
LATGDRSNRTQGQAGLEAIVLAAGSGSRFGGRKLLAPWREGVLLAGALKAAFHAPARSVTVVVGADASAVARAAAGVDPRVIVVQAPDFDEGMAASLRAGLKSLPSDAAGVFVFLGDMPMVPTEVLGKMAEALTLGALAAAPVWKGRRGNPVLLSRALFPALLELTGDAGARGVLQGLGDKLALVEAPDAGVLFDVDTQEDLTTSALPGESQDPS